MIHSAYTYLTCKRIILITDLTSIKYNIARYFLLEDLETDSDEFEFEHGYEVKFKENSNVYESCLCHLNSWIIGFYSDKGNKEVDKWIRENQEFYNEVTHKNLLIQSVIEN